MTREQADTLIRQLGTAIGMAELALDAGGTCLLALDDDTIVSIGYDVTSERLIMMSPLDAVEPTAAVLHQLLVANFLWHETAGATWALSPGGEAAVLQSAIPDQIDIPGLQAAFEAFAVQARNWNLALAAPGATAATAAPTPAAGGWDPTLTRV
jgi:hypothetical protein